MNNFVELNSYIQGLIIIILGVIVLAFIIKGGVKIRNRYLSLSVEGSHHFKSNTVLNCKDCPVLADFMEGIEISIEHAKEDLKK